MPDALFNGIPTPLISPLHPVMHEMFPLTRLAMSVLDVVTIFTADPVPSLPTIFSTPIVPFQLTSVSLVVEVQVSKSPFGMV